MKYQVTLTPAAARQIKKLDPQARRQVQAAVDLLADNPHPPGATRLVGGGGEYRVRTGDFRVIYEVEDAQLLILVVRIGHRRDVYR